jgi:hypothetical protein
MKKQVIIVFATLLLVSLACTVDLGDLDLSALEPENNSQADADAVATSVAATVAAGQANPDQPQPPDQGEQSDPGQQPAPTQAQQQPPQPSTIEGHVCYPSEYIPAMTVYLENVLNNTAVEVPIPLNGGNFSQQVPPGEYIAYAWLPDFSGGGTYSQSVLCGLTVNCTDHSLIQFVVAPATTVTNIEICDWYGGPDSIPIPPGMDVSMLTGTITGTLGYPSEYIPAMNVVAFNQNTTYWYYVVTQENDSTYSITGLPPGPYKVVAYVTGGGLAGGYSESVECGLSVNCTDHSLIVVNVTAGGTVTGVDPTDFYAPQGAFPPDPVP